VRYGYGPSSLFRQTTTILTMLRRLQTSQLKIEVLKSGEDNSSYTSIDQVTMRQQRRQSMPAVMAVGGDLLPVLRSNWLTLVLP
jgi:hypothetical protein